MYDQADSFQQAIHPHSWLLMAESHHSQAIKLYQQEGMVEFRTMGVQPAGLLDPAMRSAFVLAGIALENAIKAFLVYEHPHWVANGCLSAELQLTSLIDLHSHSTILPNRTGIDPILTSFDLQIRAWARYPVGPEVQSEAWRGEPSREDWQNYRRVMRLYGNGMVDLLRTGWIGPDGEVQPVHVGPHMLSMCEP